MSRYAADVRRGLRRLWRRRGVTALTVFTLALGIGTTTVLFSVVDAVLLRPLPWPGGDRLVAVHAVWPDRQGDPVHVATWDRSPLSWAMWDQLRAAPVFDDVGVWVPSPRILVGPRDEVVPAIEASSSLLALLGARPTLGRLFSADEDLVVSNRAILTHGAWQERFGGRPDIIGQAISLKVTDTSAAATFEIVGVLASDVRFYRESPEIVLPIGQLSNNANYPTRFLRAVGRVASGATLEQVRSTSEGALAMAAQPDRQSARVVPVQEDLLGGSARPLWLLFGGAGLLLLVACSSVAGLLLAEARARRHEFAIHAALGGTRLGILRQLTVEHVALAALASAVGLGLAALIGPAVLAAAPVGLMSVDTPAVSVRVAAFALAVGLVTPLLFGLVPILAASAVRPADGLAQGSRYTPGRRWSHRMAVTVQVALALVLVTGAAMFGETMMRLAIRPLGFDPENLGVASIRLVRPPAATATFEGNPRDDMDRFRAFLMRERVMSRAMHLDALFERIEVLPGVASAAGATAVPFVGDLPRMDVRPLGSLPDATQTFHYQGVTHGYFETMRIPILEGRDFATEDGQGRRVAIVSAELGRRLFAGGAVGRQIVWGNQPETAETYEVIGVVGNVKQRDLSDDELAVGYLLNWQGPAINHVVVRMEGSADVVLPALRQGVEQHGPEYAVTSMTTLDERLALSLHEERFRAVLASVFGFAALVLAAVGLYSLTARQVVERRQEIGVRAALGARPGHVRALMLRDGLIALGMGLAIGAPAAYAAAQSARALLFGVAPTDPHLILTAAAVLAVTASLASLVPANRAAHIDPSVTLRE